jgi:dethiobiotin synthase
MNRGVVVTGTGTDVGKTIVTGALLRMLRAAGIDAVSMKPVQTGAQAGMVAPDLRVHWDAAGIEPGGAGGALMAPYVYEPACSPHLAARLAGRAIDIDRIVMCAERLLARHQALIVEGAGGVLVPLDDTHTNLDLMVALAMPAIVVAHRGLGTINHTLLTLRALRGAGVRVLGVVFNETRDVPRDFITEDNPRAVEAFGNVAILGNIDYAGPGALDWDQATRGITGLDVIRTALLERS